MCSAYTNVLSVCYRTSLAQYITHPISATQDMFWAFVAYVNAGFFFAVFWASTVYMSFYHWVMDGLRREGGWVGGKWCGNKFMECRAWD